MGQRAFSALRDRRDVEEQNGSIMVATMGKLLSSAVWILFLRANVWWHAHMHTDTKCLKVLLSL